MRPDSHRYGTWAGRPKGNTEDPLRCVEEVWPSGSGGGGWTPYQCTRPRGHGPGGLWCKQHGKKAEEREARDKANREKIGSGSGLE